MGESGMPSQWDIDEFGSRGKEGTCQGGPPPQDDTGRYWNLLASMVNFLAEEVENTNFSRRGGGQKKW